MKGFKLSKTALLILATGAFIVVLSGLGITRYGQTSEQESLTEALTLSEARLNNMDLQPYQLQLAELREQLGDTESQLEEAKIRLLQTVISVDVVDKFYQIAEYHEIIVNSISTTKNQTEIYDGVSCLLITINAEVIGDLSHVIDLIHGLNNNFATGFVLSAQIKIESATAEGGTTANILMVAYTYEGE